MLSAFCGLTTSENVSLAPLISERVYACKDNGMKLLGTLLLLCMLILSASTFAAKDSIVSDKTFACMSLTPPTGFIWNGNSWEARRFKGYEKFLMNITVIETDAIGSTQKKQYLHFNLKGDNEDMHCGTEKQFDITGSLSCMKLGFSILYSEETGKGGISFLLGATLSDSKRDGLSVMPFTCQKF